MTAGSTVVALDIKLESRDEALDLKDEGSQYTTADELKTWAPIASIPAIADDVTTGVTSTVKFNSASGTEGGGGMSGAAVAGVVIAVLLVGGLLTGAVVVIIMKRKKAPPSQPPAAKV